MLLRASVSGVVTETRNFQTCVGQPGELSESPQQVVLAALKSEGSAGNAIRRRPTASLLGRALAAFFEHLFQSGVFNDLRH